MPCRLGLVTKPVLAFMLLSEQLLSSVAGLPVPSSHARARDPKFRISADAVGNEKSGTVYVAGQMQRLFDAVRAKRSLGANWVPIHG